MSRGGVIFGAILTTLTVAGRLHADNGVPRPDHVVIVIEENRSDSDVYGDPNYPFFNSIANDTAGVNAAKFTNYGGITHPSQPNYLALFGGQYFGISDNSIHPFSTFANAPNLGAQLLGAGKTFVGYSEDLPSVGAQDEFANNSLYARKHNPVADWQDSSIAAANQLPASVNRPFFGAGNWPSSDFSQLPDVSIVVPNQNNDGHNTFDHTADNWLQTNLGPYLTWANTHNSLLIVTWDEDEGTGRIPAIFAGPMVQPGVYNETTNHYGMLRTLEDMYGLSYIANASTSATITDVWVPEPSWLAPASAITVGLFLRRRRSILTSASRTAM